MKTEKRVLLVTEDSSVKKETIETLNRLFKEGYEIEDVQCESVDDWHLEAHIFVYLEKRCPKLPVDCECNECIFECKKDKEKEVSDD